MKRTKPLDFPSYQQNISMGEGQVIYPKLYKGAIFYSFNRTVLINITQPKRKRVYLQIGKSQFLEARNVIQNFQKCWLWLQKSGINKPPNGN